MERDKDMSLFADFFTLTKSRRIAMIVSSDNDTGLLTISIMPCAQNEDDAQRGRDPTLTASLDVFDADFVAAISSYRSKLIPLLERTDVAAVAIDKTSPNAAPLTNATPPGKTTAQGAMSAAATSEINGVATDDQAQAYREASSGDGILEEDLSMDWMKNRQPELF